MSIKAFNYLLSYLKGKSILITSHALVDLDGFVSCLLLDFLLREFNQINLINIYFSDISKSTKDFMENFLKKFPDFKYYIQNEFNPSDFDLVIVLDTNNLGLIDKSNDINLNTPFIFIDHHLNLNKKYKMNLESYNIIYQEYSSTVEIIFEILEYKDVSIPLPYKYLIASAILTDSGFLKYANNKTLIHLSKILQEEIEYQEILGLFNEFIDLSERIAKIKGLKRVELLKVDNWLIGVSHVSSYGAAVASMLISIGFDISIVYSKEKLEYRITTRANRAVCAKTGLHLGKVLNMLSNEDGGGHKGAASSTIDINIESFLDTLLENIKKILITKQSL
jgi:nanoRNase/pAp phosphatase (c-di-AMP/oligoRNAs hydrolase)